MSQTQIYRFTNSQKHFNRNNEYLKNNKDERVAFGNTMQSNNSISYSLKQKFADDDNYSSLYNSQQMTNPSPTCKQSRHKSTKSTMNDTWYEKVSVQSFQSSLQHHEDNVPYNRYLKELRNQGTQSKNKKIIIMKSTNNNKNNIKQEDIQKEQQKMKILKNRTTENSEYQNHYKNKPLPLLQEKKEQKQNLKRPQTMQNNIYRKLMNQYRTKDTNSIADTNRIKDQFEDLDNKEDKKLLEEEQQIYENMEKELEQEQQQKQEQYDENGNLIDNNFNNDEENDNFKDLEKVTLFRSSSQPLLQNSEDVSDITQSQLNLFIEQNEDYFKHLKGECACVNDKCGLCKCKYKGVKIRPDISLGPTKTVYNQDFSKIYVKKQQKENSTDLNKKLGGAETIKKLTLNENGWKPDHMTFMSVTQRDFKGKFTPKSEICKPKDQINGDFPVPKSHYQDTFYNYGKAPFELVKVKQQRTTMNQLPFYKQTTYGSTFTPQRQQEKTKPLGNNWKVSLVKSPVPFLSQTTSQNFYKPYKQKERIKKHYQLGELDIEDQGNYQGQFNTRYNRDYHNSNKQSCEYQKQKREQKYNGSQYQQVPNGELLLLQQSLQQTQDFKQFKNTQNSLQKQKH